MILEFQGYSDDVFAEVRHDLIDYDTCASGERVVFLVRGGDDALVVSGQYGSARLGNWVIGVSAWDPDYEDTQIPGWNIYFKRGDVPYSPKLVVEVPGDATVTRLFPNV